MAQKYYGVLIIEALLSVRASVITARMKGEHFELPLECPVVHSQSHWSVQRLYTCREH